MNTATMSVDSTDRATVNIKRTTVTAFLVMIIIVLAALTTIALYASHLALNAAKDVDSKWQNQETRLLDIEAKAVLAASMSGNTKVQQDNFQQELLVLRKEVQVVSGALAQANSYKAARESRDAEQAAKDARIAEQQAALMQQNEELERKGVANFDRVVTERLMRLWEPPVELAKGEVAQLQISFAQDGVITNAALVKTSGNEAVDNSVLKAASDLHQIPEMVTVHPGIYQKYLQQRVISLRVE
ncbi:TonB C-terminal domain-containing protein [Aquipseudomonas alcaligenes]|uniref:TonB C-terminal domain-containing protein n=1 Tax=Aquipseudomonas alcaligenes TaxID=43263 RepID=A0AA37CKI3_AQUAC|nr:TonB C-terminal domain-containing protein [Pseudomonas alcaligenes]BCR26173.1 hypothetical protein KAM426_37000 [Pseudomonas alcaligenes]GIZ69080.1 hypothetical protein KAM428_41650 [Pseudomonas alcaligenes]GIZ73463.1 hypothetical protein KAM429_42240 [Pseudomonas alcaligenes]GIZ77824.1 hypothetical protein KAM430_42330 [Pseudomonas alcaligenes]GIZ82167.1 hypothetical protein KAM432_42150 [Pseudomonas alcaligenes]